jgi:SAM-dependent methyltransferase
MRPKTQAAPIPTSLNLGCGRKRKEGWLNVDVAEGAEADLRFDLDARPWPLPRDHFETIQAMDVIEHVESVLSAMEEIHAVARDGARVLFTVPHFSSPNAFTDPTHRHFFGVGSFDYFSAGHELDFYSKARFRIESCRIFFHPTLLNKIVWRLANRFPREYERRWAWLFPAWFLEVRLVAVKA